MPANLPPQYFDAEKKYRLAKTTPEKILALEEMLRIMPKHKGTEKLQGELKRKISKLRRETTPRLGGGRRTDQYVVEKSGAGQVAMAGPANAGKSSLMGALTNATVDVADYPFTTRSPQAAIMSFDNVRLQLVDLPPIHPEMTDPWVFAILRNADLLWIVIDLSHDDLLSDLDQVLDALTQSNIQLIGKAEEAEDEHRLAKRVLLVGNKCDHPRAKDHMDIAQEFYGNRFEILPVSASSTEGLPELRQASFQRLNVLRAYTKMPGKEPDLREPVILSAGSTVFDFAVQIHKDFAHKLKFARIWGRDKHDGQRVQRDYPLTDGDILELHL